MTPESSGDSLPVQSQPAPEAEPPPGIRAVQLTRRYGMLTAVDNVSFSVPRGEIVGFLGPNGAGKSTTLRILAGLLSASSGEAWIEEVSVARHPERAKRRVGYMPEHNPLPEEMRVGDYLRFRGRLKNLRGRKLKNRVGEVMDLCDLNRKARRKIIGTLSKGFRQRVGLADALLAQPAVLLLDEPTIGLDPHQIRAVRQLIANLQGTMTVLLSSHILSEIELNCDRVIIINQGQIVANGTPEELRQTFLPELRYVVEVRGNVEQAENALRRADVEIRRASLNGEAGGLRLEIHTRTREDLADWLGERLSSQEGLCIRRMERITPSLEDVFLAATRRAWEQSEERPKDPSEAHSELAS